MLVAPRNLAAGAADFRDDLVGVVHGAKPFPKSSSGVINAGVGNSNSALTRRM
jgi:hypothetical protein